MNWTSSNIVKSMFCIVMWALYLMVAVIGIADLLDLTSVWDHRVKRLFADLLLITTGLVGAFISMWQAEVKIIK